MRSLLLSAFVFAMAMVAGAQQAAPAEPSRTFTVQPGQSLWQIASLTVGDPTLWPALYLANRDQIKDPSRVYPGQRLAIPEIDPERADDLRREAGALTTR
ncbi:MAG: LysM peptidoglycan-binding domain-containing protein [bacterium]|nr:LysM peptidoglycan-binding domain-containing protein [bacterium]MCP5065323.1 LysM peptidoglycan-binding domain-containing protein [bacterium]